MKNNINKDKNNIAVYGFDILGFDIPGKPSIISENKVINYAKFSEPIDLDKFDGLIIPQGIFEKIKYHKTTLETNTDVWVEHELLMERK